MKEFSIFGFQNPGFVTNEYGSEKLEFTQLTY
jgi:hypothetical protein